MKSSKEVKAMLNIPMYIMQFLVQEQILGKLRIPQTNVTELAEIWRDLWSLLKKICWLRSHILIARSALRSQEWARLGRAT